MDISPKHENAVIAACRISALQARLDLLANVGAPERSTLAFYGTTKPDPGDPPGADPIVILTMTEGAGTIDAGLFQLLLATPIGGQVTGADPEEGTIPLWARITDPAGDWWADLTVSVEGGGGDIQLVATGLEGAPAAPVARLFNGAVAQIASAVVQG
ncbi:MAG: hypothetical protein EA420_03110 [Candidatus Competibacteraceae bacterium]|nr:MAG: hypothetical protein EA420_03110 [Candidatus Competibacteraceae bacterium]